MSKISYKRTDVKVLIKKLAKEIDSKIRDKGCACSIWEAVWDGLTLRFSKEKIMMCFMLTLLPYGLREISS